MKNQELFDKTVGILVKAFINGTLEAANCSACAVGNIVADSLDLQLVRNKYDRLQAKGYQNGNPERDTGFWYRFIWEGEVSDEHNSGFVFQCEKTGYTAKQLAKIEQSFMNGVQFCVDTKIEDENYTGLMRVIDALMLIHEATPEQATEAKKLFTLAEVG